jgi:cyclopropane fatty-acyl-phospholipid synthase-like methyltransferase
MVGKIIFTIRYWLKNPPWDTGVTPPEVYQFLQTHPPGKALDLGCGTGTNVITLAEHGWQATGVDFVSQAIRIARRKAERAGVEDKTRFVTGSVLSPSLLEEEFDLLLDIGCFHSFFGKDVQRYARNLPRWLKPGGRFLLYVHLDDSTGRSHGATEAGLKRLEEHLRLVKRVDGEESNRPSAWLEYVR